MKNLINTKFYKTKEEAENKVMAFYAVNKLNDTEFTELLMLCAEKYPTV
jgi:hypothetical protein